jgi:hypothetical protein
MALGRIRFYIYEYNVAAIYRILAADSNYYIEAIEDSYSPLNQVITVISMESRHRFNW